MKRPFLFLYLFLFSCLQPLFALKEQLKMEDVPQVMSRLFHLHIENKSWNPTLVRRAMKLYVEYFDSDKAYLLEEEAKAYLSMSDEEAQKVADRLDRMDYSDFIALNQLMQKSIVRAQKMRQSIRMELVQEEGGSFSSSMNSSRYAKNEEELVLRQKARMVRFYQFHGARVTLDSEMKREKVVLLFEKKVQRFENLYLLQDAEGNSLPKERAEHLLSLRILKAFAKSLDTHTAFFSPEEAKEMRLSLEKQFEGVGVVLSEGIDGVVIADLVRGGPAEQSGQIQVNDRLVEIDGKELSQVSFEEVLDLLKKKDRSEIILGLKRVDPEMQEEVFVRVSLMKQPISMKEDRIRASYEVVEGGVIGKITLYSFYENGDGVSSERDIKEAIQSFRKVGELKGLVLDLRENSGGFLGQAVKVSGLFLGNGVVVISKYGKGDIHYLRNVTGRKFYDGPLVVLTSKMSASASEIVAKALQDYGVALIVGDERTFGKGSIQYQTITDENAELFYKVTVGKYYTVSGKSAQLEGVRADIVVPSQYAPYKIGERYLEYPLASDQVDPAYVDPLSDIDERNRAMLKKRYIPTLQKVVSFWKKNLQELKEKSRLRIAEHPQFQSFLQKLEEVRLRKDSLLPNSIDERIDSFGQDLQMQEAVYILQDMAEIQERTERVLEPTGS